MTSTPWPIFRCDNQGIPVKPHSDIDKLPPPPPWRTFDSPPGKEAEPELLTASPPPHIFDATEIELINAAMFLRRPLLITGRPGCGKSSLARAVGYQLGLGQLLRWPINTRSTLKEGLYNYDALARLQDTDLKCDAGDKSDTCIIGNYMRLGPLGTALLPRKRPRVLLIDEIDKSDIDLPNDLLDVFEEGGFEIPELARLAKIETTINIKPADEGEPWPISNGRVRCSAFPLVIMTSNGERGFPAPFLRRCIRLEVSPPNEDKLINIVKAHFNQTDPDLLQQFLEHRKSGHLATDQLLNAVYLLSGNSAVKSDQVRKALFRPLEH